MKQQAQSSCNVLGHNFANRSHHPYYARERAGRSSRQFSPFPLLSSTSSSSTATTGYTTQLGLLHCRNAYADTSATILCVTMILSPRPRRLTLVVLAFALRVAAAQQCYYPDGTAAIDMPCNSSAPASACCTSYGLCLYVDMGMIRR